MKYFGIIDKNVAAIFQLQWKIGNISDMLLQYSVLCGRLLSLFTYSVCDEKVKIAHMFERIKILKTSFSQIGRGSFTG